MSYISELRKMVGHRPLMTTAAMCILYDPARGILLERRSDNGQWCSPGGGLEPGEDAEDGLRREVKEETNLDIANPRFFTVRANAPYAPQFHSHVAYFSRFSFSIPAFCSGEKAVFRTGPSAPAAKLSSRYCFRPITSIPGR